jgi:DNA polymerase V
MLHPKLEEKPVIVLSQNDGCVISRSQEAKQLGIKMGEPFFKVKEYCERAKVIVYSSNYQLYGDISERVMNSLSQFAPEMQIYSIDEAFLKFPITLSDEEMFAECMRIKKLIKKWVGIPISIGIAPTKTLAKVANSLAKQNRDLGVFSLNEPLSREAILKEYPIEDVWGIGRRLSKRLKGIGILTVWDFIQLTPYFVRKTMGVVGERMLLELQGISALDLEESSPKQSITFSRSFGRKVTDISELGEALATFVSKACVKLRKQKQYAAALLVYLQFFSQDGESLQGNHMIYSFPSPTDDTIEMIAATKQCLTKLYIDKKKYKKCGVILLDLKSAEQFMPDLFQKGPDIKRQQVMRAMDKLNTRLKKRTVFLGGTGIHQDWKSRSDQRSPYNTTSWDHLPIVKAY